MFTADGLKAICVCFVLFWLVFCFFTYESKSWTGISSRTSIVNMRACAGVLTYAFIYQTCLDILTVLYSVLGPGEQKEMAGWLCVPTLQMTTCARIHRGVDSELMEGDSVGDLQKQAPNRS